MISLMDILKDILITYQWNLSAEFNLMISSEDILRGYPPDLSVGLFCWTYPMDLIQVGVTRVSVTGSKKKRILCISPKVGQAQPAAPSGHYILYTTCV
jgi:hypothetical protein